MDFIISNILEYATLLGAPVVYAGIIMLLLALHKHQKEINIQMINRLTINEDKFEELEHLVKEIALISLRSEILQGVFPIEDRLKSYCKYKAMDGNGYMDTYYEEVLRPLAREKAKQSTNQ